VSRKPEIASQTLVQSFGNAFAGLAYAVRTQRNAKIHLLATAVTVALSLWLGLSAEQWCLIFLAFGLVWLAELSNTALEDAVDLACPVDHPLAKTAKDVKAAAVVAAVFSAVLVGVFILGPALVRKLG
jgi:diacylglycerol kinase